MTIGALLEAIVSLIKAIPIFDKWFTKTPTQKIEDGKQAIDHEEHAVKDGGRPKWD
jgi:hypothetical protein